MPRFRIGTLAIALLAAAGFAQDVPSLSITPSEATVLVGQFRPFRAVNSNGRPAASVRWDSDSGGSGPPGGGAEIRIGFKRPGDYVIHAYAADGSTDTATLHVIAGPTFPEGTARWNLQPLPGCQLRKMVQASPVAGSSNELFAQEDCPQGPLVRALTADGLENWRKWVSATGKEGDAEKLQDPASSDLLLGSVCDHVKAGMSRDDAMKLVVQAKLDSNGFDKSNDLWTLEEASGECRITFHENTILKKQKIIEN